MSQKFDITFRRLENKTSSHINEIKRLSANFCAVRPYFVNVNLGSDVRCLLCDGENIIDVSEWSGAGLNLSEKVKPTKQTESLINEFIFKAL